MADPGDREDHGQPLLSRISNEIVRAQKQFFGKGPTAAKSYLLDDLLLIVMRGGLTTAEKTMLEFGQPDQVRQFRQLFENEMTERLSTMVEKLTGRTVVNYQSQVMFDPDLVVEIFVFDSSDETDDRAAPESEPDADGRERDATADDALDRPSTSGQ